MRTFQLTIQYQPHTHRQNRKPADAHHRLDEADLKRLRLLEPDEMPGIVPTLFGQLIVSVSATPKCRDFSHPLNAVHHVGVNIPHPAANFIAKTLSPFIGKVRAYRHRN
ncbi:MAG: hypothetical protein F4180_06295 [Chloroflexi bacterium]|nr:hypothetical protein [Chloroflexota bacterium]